MGKQLRCTVFSFFLFAVTNAQNVGIGVTTPAEKLDVDGNINVSGTIKANGVAGQNNQVLSTNGAGNLQWVDLSGYKNFVTFVGGAGDWPVPADVTKVFVEVWGGGGGASGTGGGGGGGYICGIINTSGGNVSYSVGGGGPPGSPNATDGTPSSVSYSGTTLTAQGGSGSTYTTYGFAAAGGGFSLPSGTAFIGQAGEDGGRNSFAYYQSNATTFVESQAGGKGGDGGNTKNTGGKGTYEIRDAATSTIIYALFGSPGKIPGGGGGGNVTWGGSIQYGASGMVIIHY